MGVFTGANDASRLGNFDGRPYICMGCEAAFEVQYHSCPSCGVFDVRRAEWLAE